MIIMTWFRVDDGFGDHPKGQPWPAATCPRCGALSGYWLRYPNAPRES